MFVSWPWRLVLLTDPVQVLPWEGEEIWGTVKSDPDLDEEFQTVEAYYSGCGVVPGF